MLRGYEGRIAIYQNQLIKHISDLGGKPINVSELFNLYSFDVMGDLAFGTSFNMLQNSEQHWTVKLSHKGNGASWLDAAFVVLQTVACNPWRCWRLVYVQGLLLPKTRRNNECRQKWERSNIMSFLLDLWKDEKPTGSELNMLQGDSQLIVVAGSDTTSSALTSIFYELANLPDVFSRLQDEIGSLLKPGETTSNQNLQYLDVLNRIINETLRLHPPAGLLQRKTPPEGLTIGETYIPGDTTVFCPLYVAGRSEKIYTSATEFRPERWYKDSEMIKEPSAYAPFSLGTYDCIGKPLALQILRTTLAKLVLKFDVSFAAGEDGSAFRDNARTQFTTLPGELYLRFSKRKTSLVERKAHLRL